MKKFTIMVLTLLFSGCTIVPTKNTVTLNKRVQMDKPAVENLDIGVRLEWIK